MSRRYGPDRARTKTLSAELKRDHKNLTTDLALQRQAEELANYEPPKPPVVYKRAPDAENLLAMETTGIRRFTPSRNRWPQIIELDERVQQLEQRQRGITEQIQQLEERKATASARDSEALAAWLVEQKGPRPEPELPNIEAVLLDLRADFDGLTLAIAQILEEKTRYVERHRNRLAEEADKHVDEAHARLTMLLDATAKARHDLAELRHAAIWARTYPDAVAMSAAPTAVLLGGSRKTLERVLGISTPLDAGRVLHALKQDADMLKTAITAEQRAVLAGRDPSRRTSDAVWANTPEGEAQRRADTEAMRKRHAEDWGLPQS